MIKDNLESFIKKDGIFYYSIWEYKTDEKEFKTFLKVIEQEKSKSINFDYDFQLNNGDDFYCSEFAYLVLYELNNEKFYYEPLEKKLSDFYKLSLKRKALKYIPVDFFLSLNLFNKIDEKFIY